MSVSSQSFEAGHESVHAPEHESDNETTKRERHRNFLKSKPETLTH